MSTTTIDFEQTTYKPITDRQRQAFAGKWYLKGRYITEHDGNPNKKWIGDVNVKDNPLLIQAIHDMRDGYMELLNEMRQFMSKRHDTQKDMEEQRKQIRFNKKWQDRLRSDDYGFSVDEKTRILKEAGADPATEYKGLSPRDSYEIIAEVIKRSIDCAAVLSPWHHRLVGRKPYAIACEFDETKPPGWKFR